MKIAISGANGYIASELITELINKGHSIIRISRNSIYNYELLYRELSGIDVVIHLSGAPILQRWTPRNKSEIIRSRAESSRNIVTAINQLPVGSRPKALISASAVGIYSPDVRHTEHSTNFATDFVGQVVKDWEKASDNLDGTVRKVIFRIGVVLGKKSQTIQKMIPLFKLGLGGKVGSGNQAFPFVHISDVVGAMIWAINTNQVCGTFNLVNPESITNGQFTSELSKKLARPAFFKVPEFALRMVYGQASSLLLKGPIVYPERLLECGYTFKYPDLNSCLTEILE